ncbi:DUF3784 domain-containing protein [Viridibacillus sp. YIM B01967]|uniref:DUF3784 domain-containing protein n=1 Tax=Viridibacillus soli TaxID=2798301 RepID=A0ABS1HA78_9BACL|nr:DUF3784 domain-containing protein [Viridibacillus soli]MBK3496305.1 DUF3784 domain-containing protein [Viridibacillus soli]
MEIIKIFFSSSFFIILGIIFWLKQPLDFIAGYDEKKIYNAQKLARNIGSVIILFGVEIAIVMILNLSGFEIESMLIGILGIISIILILLCYLGDRFKFHQQ